ncbi:MAG: hypothetical protein PHI97_04965 [Desulfobulbus sp.]|nr:hypothetical protein [Desulfobulbus sp.]
MLLPGGLIEQENRYRQWSFKPVSGALEMALSETAQQIVNTPRAVTRVLALALSQLGGQAATEARVAGLCVGDRQFLMRELEQHLGSGGGWFHANCSGCGGRFDFQLQYADLPVQEAGPTYPLARMQWQGRQICFRLPTGEDQERLLEIPQEQAHGWLLEQLVQEPGNVHDWNDEMVQLVDEALESMAPGIVTKIQAGCPECSSVNTVELDPYRVLSWKGEELLHQVHQLASHYHWSEAEILGLPRARRLRYLDLIDRSRGMAK